MYVCLIRGGGFVNGGIVIRACGTGYLSYYTNMTLLLFWLSSVLMTLKRAEWWLEVDRGKHVEVCVCINLQVRVRQWTMRSVECKSWQLESEEPCTWHRHDPNESRFVRPMTSGPYMRGRKAFIKVTPLAIVALSVTITHVAIESGTDLKRITSLSSSQTSYIVNIASLTTDVDPIMSSSEYTETNPRHVSASTKNMHGASTSGAQTGGAWGQRVTGAVKDGVVRSPLFFTPASELPLTDTTLAPIRKPPPRRQRLL